VIKTVNLKQLSIAPSNERVHNLAIHLVEEVSFAPGVVVFGYQILGVTHEAW
jgi:hypothetical protein